MTQKILLGVVKLTKKTGYESKIIEGSELNLFLGCLSTISNSTDDSSKSKFLALRQVSESVVDFKIIEYRRVALGFVISAVWRAAYLKIYSEKDFAEIIAGLSLWVRKGENALVGLLQNCWSESQVEEELCFEGQIISAVIELGAFSKFIPRVWEFDYKNNFGYSTMSRKIEIERDVIIHKEGDLEKCLSPLGVGIAAQILARWIFKVNQKDYIDSASALQEAINS